MKNRIYGKPTRYIELADSRLPYWKIGSGPDLVFIHGWPLDGRTWRETIKRLRNRFTCHIVDLPRAGLSSWTQETRVGVVGYGEIVYETIQSMDISGEKLGLVGQDTGGSYLRLAAARMSHQVSGIVMANTETPGCPTLALRALFLLGRLPVLESMLRITLRTWLGRASLLMMAGERHSLLHGEFNSLFLRPLVKDHRKMAGAADTLRFTKVEDFDILKEAHAKIDAPVRLVWGKDDIWFSEKAASRMLGEFAGPASYLSLPRCRLMAHEEHPSTFSDEIIKHFRLHS